MVYEFFDINFLLLADKSASGVAIENKPNKELAEEFYEPIIRKFE